MLVELSISGVRLGQTRAEVESIVGEPVHCNNPAWNRYGPRQDLLVLYRPAWPDIGPEAWQARIVVGSQLECEGKLLIEVGSKLDEVRDMLGSPVEVSQTEVECALWEYEGFYLTVDLRSQTVRSVGLKTYTAPEKDNPDRRWLRTAAGAIAC